MPQNDLPFVSDVMNALAGVQIKTWLFGGWAEELSGLRPAGPHRDLDLLFPAPDFSCLDAFLQTCKKSEEITAKRFPYKRAFLWQDVMVEVFLMQQTATGHVTDFFGSYRFLWPEDTLSHRVSLGGTDYPSASVSALRLYRERHEAVEICWRKRA